MNKDKENFTTKRVVFLAYLPAAFCALISYMLLFLPSGAGKPAFYAFLPMCFLYAAFLLHSMIKKINDLQNQLDEMKQNISEPGN